MGCGSGSCGTACASSGCNKLNTYDWLGEMDFPSYIKTFDIMEVRFKGTRKDFYRNPSNVDVTLGEAVVVEDDNGYDIGHVSMKGELVKLQMKKYHRSAEEPNIRNIVRRANESDTARIKELKDLEVPTMYKARSISMELGLSMKLSDVEYRGDRRKAVFFYTAEDRVDFRELIKRLADSFKVRVEMRQIGYRQEAGRLGAIASCGRELCCSTWLTDFKVVQTNAARYQNLSLNQLKLSGQCGRLKCCLNYELDSYLEAIREFPDDDNLVLEFQDQARYRVVKTDILKRIMWFAPLSEAGGDWIFFPVEKVREYAALNKQGEKPELEVWTKPEKVTHEEVLDFTKDMGVDSVTRLDEKERRNKQKSQQRNRQKQNKNRNAGGANPNPPADRRNPNQGDGGNQNRGNRNAPGTGNQGD